MATANTVKKDKVVAFKVDAASHARIMRMARKAKISSVNLFMQAKFYEMLEAEVPEDAPRGLAAATKKTRTRVARAGSSSRWGEEEE